MGMKPRAKPQIDKGDQEQYLTSVEPLPVEGGDKYKKFGGMLGLNGSEALEFYIVRKNALPDITRLGVIKWNFRRIGKGMAAMKPGCEKEWVITIRYFDAS